MKIKNKNPVRFSFFEQCMNYSIPFVGNIKLRLISLMRFQKIIKDPKINKFINKKDLIRKIKSLNILNHKIKVTEVTREVFEIEKI